MADAGDASGELSARAVSADFANLSEDAVTGAKWAILDTVGVCVAAAANAEEYLAPVRRHLGRAPAGGEVPAPGLGRRLPVSDAVLWLGSLAHALDFDDVAGYCHPSGPVVSAALPVAHEIDGVDGRHLVTAVALGQDLVIRLGQAVARPLSDYGWLPSIPGLLGAALTAAKLFDLDQAQTQNALGLALHQTSGTMLALAEPGSAYRAVREGFNARAGVLSASLAQAGMPGDQHSIEGRYGYFDQFFGGEYDREFLYRPDLLGPLISFKPWPCAGHPQLFLTAIHDLVSTGQVDVEQVREVRIVGCSELLPHQCTPLEDRASPRHSIDAKVSIPFLIGKMLSNATIGIDDFSAQGLRDEAATALGRRVTWSLDPALRRTSNDYGVGLIEVHHDDGRVVRGSAAYPLGHPGNPLTWDDLVAKFLACVDAAGNRVSPRAHQLVGLVEDLESVPDVRVLLETVYECRRTAADSGQQRQPGTA